MAISSLTSGSSGIVVFSCPENRDASLKFPGGSRYRPTALTGIGCRSWIELLGRRAATGLLCLHYPGHSQHSSAMGSYQLDEHQRLVNGNPSLSGERIRLNFLFAIKVGQFVAHSP
ncbi:hypothetical protein MESS4_750322 [Mesorhizobium sp. STM 4661]|nr:hypothetical protein MESS4_750322 [Mesorhizobium sp. STM 4661]